MKSFKNIPICIDFDGTIVEHDYPRIGAPVPGGSVKDAKFFSSDSQRSMAIINLLLAQGLLTR